MPHLPYKSVENYAPIAVLAAVLARRGGVLLNIDRMLLHSSAIADGFNYYLGKIRGELAVRPKLRELAVCAVAILTECAYEFDHHVALWRALGATPAQEHAIRDIEKSVASVEIFDSSERAILQLAFEMTVKVKVRSSTLSAVRVALSSDEELVEMIAVIATYNMVSRIIVATGVEIEADMAPPAVATPTPPPVAT
jgi:AhpD family alkylhydroperoxidase